MFKFKKAILIIHGFAGGTYDEEPLFFRLQSESKFDVYNFTLPGHVTNLSSDVEYSDWMNSVDDKIKKLISYGYRTIYVIGHSMGGVLATYTPIKYKQVKKIVLVAPAFEYLSLDDKSSFTKSIKAAPDIIRDYNPKEILSRALKVSIHQLKQFEKFISDSKGIQTKVNVPTLIIQGTNDSLVPYESSENIFNEMKCKKYLIEVDGVTHDVFFSEKTDEICNEITKFLKKKFYSAENIRKW